MSKVQSITGVTTKRSALLDQKSRVGEEIRKNLTYTWGFDRWYEKIIMVVLGVLGLWKLLELVGNLL